MNGLDAKDRQLLYELDKNSRQTDKELGKKIGLARNSLAHRILRLKEKGIIRNLVTLINPLKFNKSIYKLYIKTSQIAETKLKKYLLAQEGVFWLTKCEGSWDYIIAVWAYSPYDFYEFNERLLEKFEKTIVKKEVTVQVEVPFFNRAYLTQSSGRLKCLWGGKPTKETVDKKDLIILKELATNSRLNSVEIAAKTGLTARIVRYRMKELEKKGIILAYSVQLNVNKIGYDYYKTIIKLKNINSDTETKFIEYCKQNGHILYYIKTLGAWELELEWEVKEYKELIRFMDGIKEQFGNIIDYTEHLLITEEHKGEYNTIL